MSYGWPVKPFDRQHPVRGFFCDPRVGDQGGKAFHFGIDVSAPDGTPVYAVAAGVVHLQGAQNVAVVEPGGTRIHGYWHLVPAVNKGQTVKLHSLLGHVALGWGHVHFAERTGGRYRNPLRVGALEPFADFGAPVVDRVLAIRNAKPVKGALSGVVQLIAEAHDNPPISAPPPWKGIPVTPALLRWRLLHSATEIFPWHTVADFRAAMPAAKRYDSVYAAGTTQNHPNKPGLFRFLLSTAWDTRHHTDGTYRVEVEAADIRGNTGKARRTFQVDNSGV
jgi:hypothetical protein